MSVLTDFFNTIIMGCLASVGAFTVFVMAPNLTAIETGIFGMVVGVIYSVLLGVRMNQRIKGEKE